MYLNNVERVNSNVPGHFASIAVVCGLATTILMLKFLKFKASLNLSTASHREDIENYPTSAENISLAGAYRVRREEFFGNGSLKDPRKKITADMVKLPPSGQPVPVPVTLKTGAPEVSMNPRGSVANSRDSADIHGQRQHTKDKKPAGKKDKDKKKKSKPPPPPAAANPLSRLNDTTYDLATPDSSASKAGAPPPYDHEVVPNQADDTGNTSFGRKPEASSWDLVSQHRAHVTRPAPAHRRNKAVDLKYSVGVVEGNSEV